MKVIVASKNPVKINSTKKAFQKMFPGKIFEIEGQKLSSGVSDQPMNDEETLQGAINRAEKGIKKNPEATYSVGIEGGIQKIKNNLECYAWVVIKSEQKTGKAKTASFILPDKIKQLIDEGMELGEADDIVFNQKNSKQNQGTIGNLTNNNITRTSYYVEALILALIPFLNEDLY
ncbi:MAG: inosine/xanthosine triphosphatase [Nanobdellota archaeon]